MSSKGFYRSWINFVSSLSSKGLETNEIMNFLSLSLAVSYFPAVLDVNS
jgi:hypothetical protein